MNRIAAAALSAIFVFSSFTGCTCSNQQNESSSDIKIGLVTDVGGRGDQSFNDSALRGLENWAGNLEYGSGGYKPLSPEKRSASIPESLANKGIIPLGIRPVVLHAKQQEDYEPNLQLLLDDGVSLAIGVGFMLENSVESSARKNPTGRFLLVDSPILNASGEPYELSNVSSVTFREHEGAFLVGAIAGLASKSGRIGFVGGMQLPLIRRFEVGFRAGVQAVAPEKAKNMLIAYTGSFNRVEAGKQTAQDMFAKGADVVFHAAGADGLGVISAAKEAGKFAIGCDSDQFEVAPESVLTSLIKRVDLIVYRAIAKAKQNQFDSGNSELGLAEGALGYAPIRTPRISEQEKKDIEAKVQKLEALIASGSIKVPATLEALSDFTYVADFAAQQAPAAAAEAEHSKAAADPAASPSSDNAAPASQPADAAAADKPAPPAPEAAPQK